MGTLPIGFLLVGAVIYASMKGSSWALYFNMHAILIVVGGSVAVLIMSSPALALKNLGTVFLNLFKPSISVDSYRREFQELMQNKVLSTPSKNALINYASELWEQGLDPELTIILLSQKREELERGYIEAVQVLRNLAKYPPALGMTGTVMGLVSLFSVLGADNKSALGPALALAMTATFFGLILANCVVTPLADHMHVKHMQDEKVYTGIYQILILINRDEPQALVGDEVDLRAAS
ncbi:MAG: hypothetical protein EOP07_12815 [Proteobacteria bacterium]|nr:MAG: hypothetical protein EOP07_12815 [Pseudomonadota bacterium]